MKRYLFIFFLLGFMPFFAGAQDFEVKGKVLDQLTGEPLAGVNIATDSKTAVTDDTGFFLLNLPEGNYTLIITANNFETYYLSISVSGTKTLEHISLKRFSGIRDDAQGIAEVALTDDDFKSSGGQNISGLLHSSSDVFLSTASYTFWGASFRIRGFDSNQHNVYMNGTPVNDAENGRPIWSEWGGLNDATRSKEIVNGLEPAGFSFGTLGGVANIITRASLLRKQKKVSFAVSNRSYDNRLMFIYSTGMMKNNWALSISGSRRWAQEGYVEGAFYDAWAYFIAAEKKLNNRHSVALTILAAPYQRGIQGAAVQEANDLTGSNYYNPNWGYQGGEKRNAKVRTAHEPKIILNHYWNPSLKLSVSNNVGISFGRYGTTYLNWYDAPDPRPDYYRYLPGYQTDPVVQDAVTNAWLNDSEKTISQIDWNRLYQANYIANNVGSSARYIIEERRDDHFRVNLGSNIDYQLSEQLKLTGGLELQQYTGMHFKVLDDLLGSNYWVDIDQFAERDFLGDTVKLQNDLDDPSRIIKVGDKFGYEYDSHVRSASLWAMAKLTLNKIEAYLAGNASYTSFWRDGKMRNGRYPDNSLGASSKNDFFNPGLKGGITYKITGRHYLVGNIGYLTRAPYITNSFTSPRISNKFLSGLKNEIIYAGDISYHLKGRFINARLTAYEAILEDQTDIISFYHDDLRTFVNMTLVEIDKVHQGFELGADFKVMKTLSLVGVAAIGNYVYTSRPTAVISFDNGSQPDTTDLVYSKYFFVSGTPQTALSGGIKYRHPKFWFLDVNFNYFDKIYLSFNPQRRTENAISNLGPGDSQIEVITKQEKLSSSYTLDASLGKSWLVKDVNVGLYISVTNILDNQELITGGYEQMRFDFEGKNIDKFPPRYFYSYGRTYFIQLSVRL